MAGGRFQGIRQVAGVEIARLDCTGMAFARHSHDGFVLSTNLSGREDIALDRRALEAGPGDLTLYNPGQIQAGHGVGTAPWRFVSLYVPPETLWRLTGLPDGTEFQAACPHAPLLAGRLARLTDAALGEEQAEEGVVQEALAVLLPDFATVSGTAAALPSPVVPAAVRWVRDRLADSPEDPPPLEVLSDGAGLTPVQLVRAFTRAYGLPPFAWLTQHRVAQARGLLRQGVAVAEVAYALGFADQAHLTRRFRAITGLTPGVYRRLMAVK